MNYKITIDKFEGPMDLLLHLLKTDDIDIFDISIERITKQYLDYINTIEEMNLNIASEYLIMAAELLEIKSSTLLPKKEVVDDEFEEDPRETLINRLLEYKQYKEVTNEFKDLESQRKQMFTKVSDNLNEYKNQNDVDLGDIDLDDLIMAFSKFIQRKEEEKPLNTKITKKEYSVSERSTEIKTILSKKKKVEFDELFDIYKKDYIVVTFLSILNLAKKQELVISQEKNLDKIYLSLKGSE